MANYTYSTTDEMDKALSYNAVKMETTAEILWHNIIDADMGTLVRNHQEVNKKELYDSYQKATKEDKDVIDKILAKTSVT